jgi:hypothetical protein
MKLTIEQVEARMTAAWGAQAFLVPYRICGNRYVYAVTDHGEHWLPLETDWIQGQQVFMPKEGDWPLPDPWAEAINEATQRAHAYFAGRGDRASLRRLPRAQAIALGQNWLRVGDRIDTWLIPSCSKVGTVYQVNGRCTCPDIATWCKHRLARALAMRAEEMLRAKAEATGSQPARRIDLVVAYEASEERTLPQVNGNGQLVRFLADGKEAEPPARTMPELYRWLQGQGYAPNGFKWLDWQDGLRQRRQTYLLEAKR